MTVYIPRRFNEKLRDLVQDPDYGPKLDKLTEAQRNEVYKTLYENGPAAAEARVESLNEDRLDRIRSQPSRIAKHYPPEDRAAIIELIKRGWFDNGFEEDFRRAFNNAEDALEYVDLIHRAGATSLNVAPSGADYLCYIGRTSG